MKKLGYRSQRKGAERGFMTYPFSIVYSLLMPYRGSIHLDPRQKKHYRWVQLLPEDPKEMDPDILYVCRLSEALERKT